MAYCFRVEFLQQSGSLIHELTHWWLIARWTKPRPSLLMARMCCSSIGGGISGASVKFCMNVFMKGLLCFNNRNLCYLLAFKKKRVSEIEFDVRGVVTHLSCDHVTGRSSCGGVIVIQIPSRYLVVGDLGRRGRLSGHVVSAPGVGRIFSGQCGVGVQSL